ncbi:MAG: hypothetical protein IPL46_34470 [Saprospiraceae bacterium]|nr:hypothetical protein [Saprospiraceae bacterium]
MIIIILWSLCQKVMAQDPIGLQVDSGRAVLFGSDTLCCGDQFMWLPSKKLVFIGNMTLPVDSLGEYSLSVGRSRAVAPKSIAFGESTARGNASMAIGNSQTLGNLSFASGFSTSFGAASTALGNSIAGGYAAVAGGNSSTNGDLAVAFGNSRSEGDMGASFNQGKADAFLCTAIGRYNVGGGSPKDYVSTDPIFEVGIGSSTANRRNALTVRKDGFISLGNHRFAKSSHESSALTTAWGKLVNSASILVTSGPIRFF